MTAPLELCVCGHYRAWHGTDQSIHSATARCTHCGCSYFETAESEHLSRATMPISSAPWPPS